VLIHCKSHKCRLLKSYQIITTYQQEEKSKRKELLILNYSQNMNCIAMNRRRGLRYNKQNYDSGHTITNRMQWGWHAGGRWTSNRRCEKTPPPLCMHFHVRRRCLSVSHSGRSWRSVFDARLGASLANTGNQPWAISAARSGRGSRQRDCALKQVRVRGENKEVSDNYKGTRGESKQKNHGESQTNDV
jgi:hypothetical protein